MKKASTIDIETLIDIADAAIWEHEHYKRGIMDIEEAVRVAIRAVYCEFHKEQKILLDALKFVDEKEDLHADAKEIVIAAIAAAQVAK